MEQSVLPLLIQIAGAVVVPCAFVAIGYLFSPRRYGKKKMDIYECGAGHFQESRAPIKIKFYTTAVLFILFEIEILFLFPFAGAFREFVAEGTAGKAVIEFALFIGVLLLGYIYARMRNALAWRE